MAAIPAFSPQVCAQELADITPLPLIGLLDAIIDEIKRRRLDRVAVFGARVTMETGLFGRLEKIVDLVAPHPGEVGQISEIYRKIVEHEQASAEEFDVLRSLAHTISNREHLDAIVLAGTDFSFVFRPENTDFAHIDGARTHIVAIMQAVVREDE